MLRRESAKKEQLAKKVKTGATMETISVS